MVLPETGKIETPISRDSWGRQRQGPSKWLEITKGFSTGTETFIWEVSKEKSIQNLPGRERGSLGLIIRTGETVFTEDFL